MPIAIKNGEFNEVDTDDDVDYELVSPSQQFSTHINLIPIQSAVQGPRLFYGARFYNQAMPVANAESPLVQNQDPLDKDGKSFDELFGKDLGAVFSDEEGEVAKVTPDEIWLKTKAGKKKFDLYNNFPFNRKSSAHNTSLVKVGDKVGPGQILAKSNYTNDKGELAMGLNARVGVVPYKGYSMDDAIVISKAFADKLQSEHTDTHEMEHDRDTKIGLSHFRSIFPEKYKKAQLETLDEQGVVKPGTILKSGDPIILATRPRIISSLGASSGKLTKSLSQARSDASQIWDADYDAEVVDVFHNRNNIKVITKAYAPTREGDKIVMRTGAKGIVSLILPDERMPRGEDGQPLEVLLNPLSLPSRANSSLPFEIMLGKLARKLGKPIKTPGFTQVGERWYEKVLGMLEENGVSPMESVYDPSEDRNLENPVLVGDAYVMKLHHTGSCFDEQTEVLTQEGWKFWNQVTMEDELATSDVTGQKLFFEKPLHLFEYDYKGILYGFQSRYVDYLVTPNHNLWIKSYYGQKNFSLKQASAVHAKRWKIKQFGFEVEDIPASQPFVIEDHSYDWNDFCELVGWWVTEGCVTTNKTGIVVYQSQSANPEKVQRIEDLINRLGLKWSYFKSEGNVMGFSINEKHLATYFSNYGSHSHYKRVPREVILGPISGCKRALESIILGDGHREKTATGPSVRLRVTSKQLVDDFQEMAIRCGQGSIVRELSAETKKRKENPHYLPQWQASLTETRNYTQLDGDRNPEAYQHVPYNGKVYCAEMRSGLLYVRRNGKPMLSGNSKASSRGQGSYDLWRQPAKGGSESAKAKRLSGLESQVLLSSGAYANLREGSTLRGQQQDEYWRNLRSGLPTKKPGVPFAWEKTMQMLRGAGMNTTDDGKGTLRLGPMRDNDLENFKPVEIKTGELLNLNTMAPVDGGLFDKSIVGNNGWGKISLPFKVPNPAYEDSIRVLLGLKKKEVEDIMNGVMELPEHLR